MPNITSYKYLKCFCITLYIQVFCLWKSKPEDRKLYSTKAFRVVTVKKLEIILFVLLIMSLIINIYWGLYFYPKWYPHNVNIPSETQINNFCKDQEFDYGWLSSTSCKENQVQCYRKIFDMVQYSCIEWRN